MVIKINCDVRTDGVDTPVFDIEHSKKATTTIQWTNEDTNCSANAVILFKGDTPLIDGEGRQVHTVNLSKDGVSPAYNVQVPALPNPSWPAGKHYKFYKYDLKVGNTTFDPGGGVRP